MGLNSFRKIVKQGIKSGSLSFAVLTVFSCFAYWVLLGGNEFVSKQESLKSINGISHNFLIICVGILAVFVPVFTLKYKQGIDILTHCVISSIVYFVLAFAGSSFGASLTFGILYPLGTFDAIPYIIFGVPIGSLVGTIIAVFKNDLKKNMR